MNAGEAGKLVARFINRSWPNDRQDIFEILRLGLNKGYNEGKWFGQTREYVVPIRTASFGNYIVGPTDYPVLLAANLDTMPVDIRGNYFKFHKNGDGWVTNRQGCRWVRDVFDLGVFPTIEEIKINSEFLVGVRALGNAGPNEKAWINGTYGGHKVYTYKLNQAGIKACGCTVDPQSVDTINGVELDISQDFNYICNIRFEDITSIRKTITRTPVEVVAIDPVTGKGVLLARLEPNETEAKYRRYQVPDRACRNSCLHGIFKIREQEAIISDTDELIINNSEAIISLCMAIDNIFYKQDVNAGAGYFLQGISTLDKNKQERESPDVFPVQVQNLMHGDMPSIMNYLT